MERAKLRNWLDGYKLAWEQANPEAVGTLFAPDATYQISPFFEPLRGRDAIMEYWHRVPHNTQKNIGFDYEILGYSDGMNFVNWWASFDRVSSGKHVELNGIFVLTFEEAGLCKTLQEWWHKQD